MTPDPIRVIVLGPYSGDTLTVAGNIRRGMNLATEAALAGFAAWPCWFDWDMATRADLPMEWFKSTTIAWMKVAEAILLAPNWEQSEGVRAELAIAHEIGIPVFTSLESLICWRNSLNYPDAERPGDHVLNEIDSKRKES